MSKFAAIAVTTLLAVTTLVLSGCSQLTPKPWSQGSGPVKILASTNVWGSISHLVAGNTATVSALIANVNQDPHSFEATARDQLLVNNADVVVLNGGGYDDFMLRLIAADPTPAIVVNAFMSAGNDKNRNEHIWYSVSQVRRAARAIQTAVAAELKSAKYRPLSANGSNPLLNQLQASMASFDGKLQDRQRRLAQIKRSGSCGRVFSTEPLIDYLLEDAGCDNLTPPAYSRAIEEERDVPPAVLNQARKILTGGIDFVAQNSSVSSPQIKSLLANIKTKRGIYGFGELLEQDPRTMKYSGDYLTMLDHAINVMGGNVVGGKL